MNRTMTFYTSKIKYITQKNKEPFITSNFTITYEFCQEFQNTIIYQIKIQASNIQMFIIYPNKMDIQNIIFKNDQCDINYPLSYKKIKIICNRKCTVYHGYYIDYVSSMGKQINIHFKLPLKGKFLFPIMSLGKNTTNIFQFKNNLKYCADKIQLPNNKCSHNHPSPPEYSIFGSDVITGSFTPTNGQEIHQTIFDIINDLDDQDDEFKRKLYELYHGNCDIDLFSPIEIKKIPKPIHNDSTTDIAETMDKLDKIICYMQGKIISMQKKEQIAHIFIKNILDQIVNFKNTLSIPNTYAKLS